MLNKKLLDESNSFQTVPHAWNHDNSTAIQAEIHQFVLGTKIEYLSRKASADAYQERAVCV